MARIRHLTLMALAACLIFFSISYIMTSDRVKSPMSPIPIDTFTGSGETEESSSGFKVPGLSDNVLHGESIAPKLENATAKAELGRATWKFLHTTMSRYPDEPTEDDQIALKTFIHLLGRLYPCGDCAKHFRMMLKEFPPQTSSRNAAAGWACYVHNIVNERLHKPEFDCNKIGDFYDCGCGEEGKDKKAEGDTVEGETVDGNKAEGEKTGDELNVELNREG